MKLLLYLIRWQLSTPILWIVVSNLGAGFVAVIIGNLVGGFVFFNVDKYIFKETKMKYVVEVKKSGKWKKHSDHQNKEYAIINRDVQRNMGLESRIKYGEEIIDAKLQEMPEGIE